MPRMRRKFSFEIIEFAKQQFINGIPPNEIAKLIFEKFKQSCSVTSIKYWAKAYNWTSMQIVKQNVEIMEAPQQQSVLDTKRRLDSIYGSVTLKLEAALKQLEIKKPGDYAKFLEIVTGYVIEEARKAISGAFLIGIIQILDMEILDIEQRRRIKAKIIQLPL